VELEIFDGDRSIVRRQVSQQLRLRLALPDNVARHEMTLRMLDSSGGRESLPLLERRDALAYKVTSLKVGTAPTHVYDMAGWRRAYDNPGLQFEQTAAGIEIVTDSGKYSYCAHYDGLESPADGTYRFELEFSRVDGRFQLSALDDERNCWLPSTVEEIEFNGAALLSLSVDIPQGTKFSLVVSNYRPEGGISRFVLRRLVASAPFERLIRKAQPLAPVTRRWRSVVMGVLTAALRRVTRAASSAELQRARRYEDRIVDESERFRELEARVAAQNPLADLAPLVRLLRENRPPHIHENACGDFQLLAREDWHALRGYPELEMFSMNVDGLFEAIASCAGISEHLLDMPCCIYHLEHEKGSGWTPEGEALLQRRIAESGIGWLDLSAVRICTTYMHWLGRPMIFNGADWGFGDAVLPETTLERVPVGS
jgi:hypothetical protein